jgi:hypothetical protein
MCAGHFAGVYHTGVEVCGHEYSFGWNNRGTTGVFSTWPRAVVQYFEHRPRAVVRPGLSSCAPLLYLLIRLIKRAIYRPRASLNTS